MNNINIQISLRIYATNSNIPVRILLISQFVYTLYILSLVNYNKSLTYNNLYNNKTCSFWDSCPY